MAEIPSYFVGRVAKLPPMLVSEWTLVFIAILAIVPSLFIPIPLWAYALYYPVLAVVACVVGVQLVVAAFHDMVRKTRSAAAEARTRPGRLFRR